MTEEVRFRCANCRAKLVAPDHLRGFKILCSVCKKSTPVGASISEEEAQERLKKRLELSIQEWVRATCACGKVIKAPLSWAGKTGACPRCKASVQIPDKQSETDGLEAPQERQDSVVPSIELLPSSEESGITPVGDNTTSAADFDFREIKYNPLHKPKESPEEHFDGFVRAKCQCGFRVKAPAEMGGKTGSCPKCGRPVIMPPAPRLKLMSALDAMAGHEEIEEIDQSDDEASMVLAVGSQLSAALESATEIAAPVDDEEWEKEKQSRALNIKRFAQKTLFDRIMFDIRVKVWPYQKRFREMIWENPVASISASVLMFLAGSGATVYQYHTLWKTRPPETVWKSPVKMVSYYDVGTGKLVKASSTLTPPLPGQPNAEGQITDAEIAVRAYLFSCHQCEESQPKTVALVETMEPGVSEAWKRRMIASRVPEMPSVFDANETELMGRFISRPDPIDWVPAESKEGADLRREVLVTSCPDGGTAMLCRE